MSKYIYLIQSDVTGKYKIGVSKNPKKRVEQLQTGNNEKLRLIETYYSSLYNKVENNLHNNYSHVKEQGEWFNLTIEDEVKFKTNCQNIENKIKILLENDNPFI